MNGIGAHIKGPPQGALLPFHHVKVLQKSVVQEGDPHQTLNLPAS